MVRPTDCLRTLVYLRVRVCYSVMLICSARITQVHIPDIEHNCDGVHGLEERNMKTINVSEITDDTHMEAIGNDLLENCHEVRSICRFYIYQNTAITFKTLHQLCIRKTYARDHR